MAAKVVTPTYVGPRSVATNISPDKLAVTFLSESLLAEYGPEQAAKTFTPLNTAFLEIPVTRGEPTPGCDLLGYSVDVRGFVSVTSGARATMTVIFAGQSQQVEFPFDREMNDDFNQRFFFLPHRKKRGEPVVTDAPVVSSPLRIQVLLQVETADPGDAAMIKVDTLDLEARPLGRRDQSPTKETSAGAAK